MLRGADIEKSRSSGIVMLAGTYGILDKNGLGNYLGILACWRIFLPKLFWLRDETQHPLPGLHKLIFYRFAGRPLQAVNAQYSADHLIGE